MAARLPAAGRPTALSEHFAFYHVGPKETRPPCQRDNRRCGECAQRPNVVTFTKPEPVACGVYHGEPGNHHYNNQQQQRMAVMCWPHTVKSSCNSGSENLMMLRCPQPQTPKSCTRNTVDQSHDDIQLNCRLRISCPRPPPQPVCVILKQPQRKIHRLKVYETEECCDDENVEYTCIQPLNRECREQQIDPRPGRRFCVYRSVNAPVEAVDNRPCMVDHRLKKTDFRKAMFFTRTGKSKSCPGKKSKK